MITLTKEDIQDFVQGAAIMGTGGGGDPGKGAEILLQDLAAGRPPKLGSIEELEGKDGVLVVPYLVGTIAQSDARQAGVSDMIKTAVRAFEEEVGRPVIGTVATEVGGLNSAMALHAGAYVGIPAVDADVVGRAAPETCHTVLNLADIPLIPAVVAVGPNDVRVLGDKMSAEEYETTIRGLSTKAGGYVAVVDSPCRPSAVKDLLIRGTMTKAVAIGRAKREAVRKARSPVGAAARELAGKRVFRGTVSEVKMKNAGGFLKGTVALRGAGQWEGKTLESFVLNEHIMAWREGRPLVMPPDCIAFLHSNGEAIMNNVLEPGTPVHVLAWRSPAIWRSAKGLTLFGPRHFGLDFDYVPVEKLARF